MRQIGILDDELAARRFVSYLATQGIDAMAEPSAEHWSIWVREEDHRAQAQEEFHAFRANPDDPRYAGVERAAETLRREQAKRREAAERAVVDMRLRWRRGPRGLARGGIRRQPVTTVLIFLSGLVTLGSWFGTMPIKSLGGELYTELAFSDLSHATPGTALDAFASIRQGEVWRLITPIFLHFSFPHILFNMLLFHYLSGQMERLRGPIRCGALIALVAIVSNVTQAYFAGPRFGGMSGVVYGLLGYIWMKSWNEPGSGFQLDSLMLTMAIIWFFLCIFGVFGDNIANYAHGGGLVTGILVGLAPSGRVRSSSG